MKTKIIILLVWLMNHRQTLVLILGAIAVLVTIFTAPKFYMIPSSGGYIRSASPPYQGRYKYVPVVDVPVTILRITGVVIATILVWFALKDKKGT